MLFEVGAFEKWLGHEITSLMDGIRAFLKKNLESSLATSTMWGHNKKKRLSMNQEVVPH